MGETPKLTVADVVRYMDDLTTKVVVHPDDEIPDEVVKVVEERGAEIVRSEFAQPGRFIILPWDRNRTITWGPDA